MLISVLSVFELVNVTEVAEPFQLVPVKVPSSEDKFHLDPASNEIPFMVPPLIEKVIVLFLLTRKV